MYKVKKKDPKNILIRVIGNEVEQIDFICQFHEEKDRSAMIRQLIKAAYVDLTLHIHDGVYQLEPTPAPSA